MALITSAAASLKNTWGFSPQSIPGLALWLDGADTTSITGTSSSVTAWRDKSGSGYTAVPQFGIIGRTTLNGQNALNFGTSRMRIPSFTWTSSFTQIFVAYASSTGGIIIDTMNAAATQYGDYVYTGNGNLMNINNPDNSGILQVRDTVAGSVQPNNTWFIFSIGYGSTGTVAINYTLNGTVRSTAQASGSGGSATNPPLTLYINGVPSSTLGSGVRIAELIHFNTDITTPQRQQVEGYLAAKWGLKANLPATHPYYATNIIPFNRPFYPTDISGCQLWLDGADRSSMTFSSGSSVSSWNDKSGNGLNVSTTANFPVYTTTGVQFTGSTPTVLSNTAAYGATTALNCFVVYQSTLATTRQRVFRCSRTGNFNDATIDTTFIGVFGTTSTNNYQGPLTYSTNTPSIISLVAYSAPSIAWAIDGSGSSVWSFSGTAAASSVTTLTVGGGQTDTYFTGFIMEVLMFDTFFTRTQQQQVEQYLAWKWGLVANLPTGHPGKLLPAFSTNFTPKSISGLALWLDAADASTITGTSSVTVWANKGTATGSGSRTSGTFNSTSTKINGLPAMAVGAGAIMSLPSITYSTTSRSIFVIVTVGSSLTGYYYLRAGGESISPQFYTWEGDPDIELNYSGANRLVTRNPTNYFNQTSIVSITSGIYVNGTSQPLSINNGNSFSPGTSTGGYLGESITAPYVLGEILVFDGLLTDSQRQQVEGYLAWKWGLQSSLPSTHAYAKFSP